MSSPATATVPSQGQARLAGIGMMLLGILMFSLNDVMGKWLVATYSVGQVLLICSVAALLVLAPILWREKPRDLFRPSRPRVHLLRVGAAMAEVACFYWAVSYLPLADTMTFYLAGPIYVTAAAALVLGERVSLRGWLAVLAAFVGVVIALRPSAATLTAPALVAVAGSMLYALYLLCTRSLRGASNLTLTSWSFVGALLLGLVWAPFAWVTPSLLDFVLIGLLGAVALCAHVCVNHSLKLAPASVVVPYQYTMLLWAVVFGYVVFGDVPAFWMLVGAVIIILSGLFLFLNEQREARGQG
jgi:drug/metabolite transporter (DMT)-like permease